MTTFEKECHVLCKNFDKLFGGEWSFQVDYFRCEVRFGRMIEGHYRYWAFDSNKIMYPEDPDIPWQRAVVYTINQDAAARALDFAYIEDRPAAKNDRATSEDFKGDLTEDNLETIETVLGGEEDD